jgi:hypothetical protein
MRLLNTATLGLRDFLGDDIPSYAILSHTWGDEEVLLDDLRNGTAASKKGYAKLMGCCKKAAGQDYEWVWIDTCCIDKSSSAELSEAINSMYQWYHQSDVCYAYLEDVEVEQPLSNHGTADLMAQFIKCRWMSRGWTLQELIAPRVVEFYSASWAEIGTKASLSPSITEVTHINPRVLRGERPSTCTIAERMRWAAGRKTRRKEDIAYCLLGLFEVNLPLLYGEGDKAFLRLQEQILRQEEDYTIFAWTSQMDTYSTLTGLLASSPNDFAEASIGNGWKPTLATKTYFTNLTHQSLDRPWASVQDHADYRLMTIWNDSWVTENQVTHEPLQITNRGLRLTLPVLEPLEPGSPLLVWIYCLDGASDFVCLLLDQKWQDRGRTQSWGRHSARCLVSVHRAFTGFAMKELFCHRNGLIEAHRPMDVRLFQDLPLQTKSLQVRILPGHDHSASIHTRLVWPARRHDSWSGDILGFQDEPALLGSRVFDTVNGYDESHLQQRFIVFFGIHLGLWFCQVAELDPLREVDEITLTQVTKKNTGVFHAGFDLAVSDRAAVRSATTSTVFHASIRTAPGLPVYSASETIIQFLEVGVCCEEECEPWVRLLLASEPSRFQSRLIGETMNEYIQSSP